MSYLPHQIEASNSAIDILKQYNICLVAGLPRTGKTRTALRVTELSSANRILVVTKKAAISGWRKELAAIDATKDYTVTNYEQVAKLTESFDFAIIDESHNIGRPPKPSNRLKALRAKVYGLPILLLTGTPAAETRLSYYFQFCLSPNSPFAQYKNFYKFFAAWGIPKTIYVNGRLQEIYKEAKPGIMAVLEPYIVTITQDQAGIVHQAKDCLHVVSLSHDTKRLITTLQQDKVVTIGTQDIAFDSDIAERLAVHQIEYGGLLVGNDVVELPNCEVMEYLKRKFKDSEKVGFMAHYRSTRQKLANYFKHAQVFSSNAHAEGVDLSHLDHFVIVNSDFSGAKFIQRRERCTNINRQTPVIVHHITTDYGISKSVYDTLITKKDFTLSLYRQCRDRTDITKSYH